MMEMLVRWIISAVSLLVVSRLVPSFEVDGLRSIQKIQIRSLIFYHLDVLAVFDSLAEIFDHAAQSRANSDISGKDRAC